MHKLQNTFYLGVRHIHVNVRIIMHIHIYIDTDLPGHAHTSHGTHTHESQHTYLWVMAHTYLWNTCCAPLTIPCEWVISQWWVMAHKYMINGTHVFVQRLLCPAHTRIRTSHVTAYMRACEQRLLCPGHNPVWMSHVKKAHANESWYTYAWVTAHIFMSHGTHIRVTHLPPPPRSHSPALLCTQTPPPPHDIHSMYIYVMHLCIHKYVYTSCKYVYTFTCGGFIGCCWSQQIHICACRYVYTHTYVSYIHVYTYMQPPPLDFTTPGTLGSSPLPRRKFTRMYIYVYHIHACMYMCVYIHARIYV